MLGWHEPSQVIVGHDARFEVHEGRRQPITAWKRVNSLKAPWEVVGFYESLDHLPPSLQDELPWEIRKGLNRK